MNEADVSSKLRVELTKAGAKAMKVSDRFHASRPDLFICYHGLFAVLEMKVHPRTPTEAQTFELTDFVLHEAKTFVGTYHKSDKCLHIMQLDTGTNASFHNYKEAALWLLKQIYSPIRSEALTLQ